jgi:hypothetical protein
MNFTITEQCKSRLNRTELAVPGSNRRFIEKAAAVALDGRLIDIDSIKQAEVVVKKSRGNRRCSLTELCQAFKNTQRSLYWGAAFFACDFQVACDK